MMQDSPTSEDFIRAYFSHSYRYEDRDVNLFFWHLFSGHGFYFSVDPKSERLYVSHLERLLRRSDCFVAVVTRRKQETSLSLDLPSEITVLPWTHSPFIYFENCLAIRALKPRLIFVEEGLDANLFRGKGEVHFFERDLLDKRRNAFSGWIQGFAHKVRAYKHYRDQVWEPRRTASLMLTSSSTERQGYTPEVIELAKNVLKAGGYRVQSDLDPNINSDAQLALDLDQLDLLISEIRPPFVTLEALAFAHARFIPTLRVCWLAPGETRADVQLPAILREYETEDIDPIIAWSAPDELALGIARRLQKFEQARLLLDDDEKGGRYFRSAGRRLAKVFVSNANAQNELAMRLVQGFQMENIQFFHYMESQRVGSAWKEVLDRELDECEVFVALVSDDYHMSQWCQYELKKAFGRWPNELRLYPYLVERTRLPDMIKDDIQCKPIYHLPQSDIVDKIVEDIDQILIEARGNQRA